MASATEIVTAFMMALESKDFDMAASYLSDDFIFSGSTPQPLNKDGFMTTMSGLASGIPNLSYHFRDIHDIPGQQQWQEGRVEATIQMTGTQSEGFVLPPLSLPPIPQTAQSVSLPQEHWQFAVKGDTIVMITTDRVPGGGITGLLKQLGIEVPIVQ